MEDAKKVKAEVVGKKKKNKKWERFKKNFMEFIFKIKLAVAISLDLADLVLANIPIVNTLWDFFTFAVLFAILRNKWLAFAAFGELPLVGMPFLGQIDALIPIATILTIADIAESRMHSSM